MADISRHVDKYGMFTSEAGYEAWKLTAGLPAGSWIRLHIGAFRASHPSDLVHQLKSAGVLDAARIEITGTDAEGIRSVAAGLASLRDNH